MIKLCCFYCIYPQIVQSSKIPWDNLIAFGAMLIALISAILSYRILKIQREHNYKSVSPFAEILVGDYQEKIYVSIANHGIGPLIVTDFKATFRTHTSHSLIDIVPSNVTWKINWADFVAINPGRVIPIGGNITIIEAVYSKENYPTNQLSDQDIAWQALRDFLSETKITISYTDVYNKTQKTSQRLLNWFNRNDLEKTD